MSLNDGRFYNISLSEITIASNYKAEIKVNSMVKTSKMLYPEHLSKYPEHLGQENSALFQHLRGFNH